MVQQNKISNTVCTVFIFLYFLFTWSGFREDRYNGDGTRPSPTRTELPLPH